MTVKQALLFGAAFGVGGGNLRPAPAAAGTTMDICRQHLKKSTEYDQIILQLIPITGNDQGCACPIPFDNSAPVA